MEEDNDLVYVRLGLTKERGITIIQELLELKTSEKRFEDATSFEGPERDYAMYICGLLQGVK
jgi:hypothetical protein